jgi:mono/diheme cytochrome c family protein
MQRGAALAQELDCWSCHAAALRDPDAAAAPSLFGGSRRPPEIARRIREAEGHTRAISDTEVASLVAWIAVMQYEADRATARAPIRGGLPEVERLARRQCFSCHGDLGQGGVSNPGSLKGYVPGFFGRDYDALTWGDDPDVVREWIRDGLPGFFHWGVGSFRPGLWYSERQQVKMPAFGQTLSPGQWEALAGYMSLLRELGPLDAAGVIEYRKRLGLPVAEDG